MFASPACVLLALYIARAAGTREEAPGKSSRSGGNASATLRQCISDAVLCASEYLRSDVVSRSQKMLAEHEVPGMEGGRCCQDAGGKPTAEGKPQDVCNEAECVCRYSRREQRLMRLVRQVDATAFKRFLYGRNKGASGRERQGMEDACGAQPDDLDEKFRLHVSSYLKRWLFLIAYLGYSFLRPELHSSDLWSDALSILPLLCVIKTEVCARERREARRCKACNEPSLPSSLSRLCKSCENKMLLEKYNRVKQIAQKNQVDKKLRSCKNLRRHRQEVS